MDLHHITSAWALPGPVQFRPIDLGYFNLTTYVDTPTSTYVLRVQRGGDLDRIRREQALLMHLQDQGFPLAVPAPLPARSGETLVQTDLGYAALLPCLPGTHPDVTDRAQAYALGEALGDVTLALSRLAPEPVGPAYGDLHLAHPLVSDPWSLPTLLPVSPDWQERIGQIFSDLTERVPPLRHVLPQQVIHGDFINRNALMQAGQVTGALDFEFCAHDLRALDLAIALGGGPNALRGPEANLAVLDAIGQGYASRVELIPQEIAALPTLIRLRRANMLVRFEGRRRQGLEEQHFVAAICHWLLEADDWLTDHGEALTALARRW